MSEIFDEYAKIALESGLIKKEAQDSKKGYYNNEPSDFQLLYGVKPDGEQKDIVDQAHPEPAVVSPAYDRIHGLVENIKERQNVIVDIVQTPNTGKLTQKRYVRAYQDLADELIRIAFILDREGKEDLMKLADSAAERLVKKALGGWGIAAIVAGAVAVISYLGASQNFLWSQGVKQDSDRFVVEMQEAVDDYPEHPEFAKEFGDLVAQIKMVRRMADKVSRLQLAFSNAGKLEQRAKQELAVKFIDKSYDEQCMELLQKYKEAADHLSDIIPSYVALLKTREKDYEEQHYDWWESIRRMYRTVVPTDIKDAYLALEALQKSLQAVPREVDAKVKLLGVMREGQDAVSKLESILGRETDLEPPPRYRPEPKPEPFQVGYVPEPAPA